MMFGPRILLFFLERFSSAQDTSLLVSSFPKQFLLFSARHIFRTIILFLRTHILRCMNQYSQPFSYRLLRTTGFLLYFWQCHLSSDPLFLLHKFQAFSRALFCFAPRLRFSSDWLSFIPRTSSRPSAAAVFFSTAVSCLPITLLFRALVPVLLKRICFVLRSDFHSIHAHILLFPEICFFVLTFRLVWHFVSFCRSQSFVFITRCPLLSAFGKQ